MGSCLQKYLSAMICNDPAMIYNGAVTIHNYPASIYSDPALACSHSFFWLHYSHLHHWWLCHVFIYQTAIAEWKWFVCTYIIVKMDVLSLRDSKSQAHNCIQLLNGVVLVQIWVCALLQLLGDSSLLTICHWLIGCCCLIQSSRLATWNLG